MATQHGGRRPGAGRPRGKKNPATLEREAVQRAFNQRVLEHADRLFHAQLAVAEGCSFLMRRPKNGGKAMVVTDPETIRRYVDGELAEDDGYYFVHTERPDASAADRLLNRPFGRARETVEHQGEVRVPGSIAFVVTQQPGSENRT